MDEVLSFLTSLSDEEVNNIFIFLKHYIATRSKMVNNVDKKLEKLEKILRLQNCDERQIEHSKISMLRSLKIIDKNEEHRRILELYKED